MVTHCLELISHTVWDQISLETFFRSIYSCMLLKSQKLSPLQNTRKTVIPFFPFTSIGVISALNTPSA